VEFGMKLQQSLALFLILAGASAALPAASAPVHTSYLWHMHQPIYWPERSTWNGTSYQAAYETMTLGSAQNDLFSIFNKDDRVSDYQGYPKGAIQSVLHIPDAGAQVSFAGSLIQNLNSLAAAGWNGGRYPWNWTQPYRDAQAWTTSGGNKRLEPVIVAFHHSINPLADEAVFRRMIQAQKSIMPATWGTSNLSVGTSTSPAPAPTTRIRPISTTTIPPIAPTRSTPPRGATMPRPSAAA
jgi:hypothetical protein